jgi:hypothetical protein
MTLEGSLRDAVMPDGMSVRALDGIDDWTKAEALQAEVGLEDGRDPKTYGPYLVVRNAGRRAQITRGLPNGSARSTGTGSSRSWACSATTASRGVNPLEHGRRIGGEGYVAHCCARLRCGRWAVRRMLTLSLWLRPTPMLDVCTVK